MPYKIVMWREAPIWGPTPREKAWNISTKNACKNTHKRAKICKKCKNLQKFAKMLKNTKKIVQKMVWKSKKLAHLEKINTDGVSRFFHLSLIPGNPSWSGVA